MKLNYLFILTVLMLECLTACSQAEINSSNTTIDEAMLFTEVTFPSEIRNFMAWSEKGVDTILYIRFNVSSHVLPVFLNELDANLTLVDSYSPFPSNTGDTIKWWNSDDAKDIKGGQVYTNDKVYEILISRSNDGDLLVYLRVYSI